jgi:hypothetical protein
MTDLLTRTALRTRPEADAAARPQTDDACADADAQTNEGDLLTEIDEAGLTDLSTETDATDAGAVRAETEETGGLPPVSDAELEAQALAAGPVDVADDDAVSYWDVAGRNDLGLLPDWYMPTAGAGSRRLHGWRRGLAWSLVATFLSINAAGLCSTYGRIEGFGL